MLVNKLCRHEIKFLINCKFLRHSSFIIAAQNFSCNSRLNIYSTCHFQSNEKLSAIKVNGKQIKIEQHYFEAPVRQPRPPIGQRRVADLTGLKGNLYTRFFVAIHLSIIFFLHIGLKSTLK